MSERDKDIDAYVVVMANAMLDSICEHLRVRACDPWDDDLWPAANIVLEGMADELECPDFRASEICEAFGMPFCYARAALDVKECE